MTVRGRLRWEPLEGGTWVLTGPEGEFVLLGDLPRSWEGESIEVRGERVESFGISMRGEQFAVESAMRLSRPE